MLIFMTIDKDNFLSYQIGCQATGKSACVIQGGNFALNAVLGPGLWVILGL